MDEAYWKARCEAAEAALQRARSALGSHPARRAVLQILGDLTPTEDLPTQAVAARLGWTLQHAFSVLTHMDGVGLVNRTPRKGRAGGVGNQVRWKLGHLVQVEAVE